jgi:hypothetical protein
MKYSGDVKAISQKQKPNIRKQEIAIDFIYLKASISYTIIENILAL